MDCLRRANGESGKKLKWNMNKKGFTLIELLVVIAVIGLLVSIVLVSVNNARVKARDIGRLSDLRQMQTALEMYYDTVGEYPRYDGGGDVACINAWAVSHPNYINCWNDLASKLSPYLSKIPLDPLNGYPPTYAYYAYQYRTMNSGQGYYLLMDPEALDPDDDEGCYAGVWYCIGMNWQ